MKIIAIGILAALTAAAPAGAAAAAPQTVGGCGTIVIGKAEAGDPAKLAAGADCFGKASVVAASAASARRERLAGMPTPAPSPAPAAVPAFVPTPSIAPTLAGLPSVASGLDVDKLVARAGGTGALPQPEAKPPGYTGLVEGAFRFLCAPSHNAYDDPIVYPGQPGASHLHTFFGNTKANAGSTYASLRTTGDSTCNNALNRSAYWISAMLNGHGKIVMPDYLSVYYKRESISDPKCSFKIRGCLPLPRGLRYVFGYNMQKPGKNTGSFYWNCIDSKGNGLGHFATLAEVAKLCTAPGSRVGAILTAPSCWNGRELDSPDHRSHMADGGQDGYGHYVCPSSHPYLLPHFVLAAWYTIDATLADWYLASDRMPGMPAAVPGSTLHSDWFGAWEDSIQARWTAACINKMLSCSGGDLGDGDQLPPTSGYDMPNGRPLAELPRMAAMQGMAH